MKKGLLLLLTLGLMLTFNNTVVAQDGEENAQTTQVEGESEDGGEAADPAAEGTVEENDSNEAAMNAEGEAPVEEEAEEEATEEEETGHKVILKKFLEGGAGFMSLPLICLILGLSIALERIISLAMASINTNNFIDEVESAVKSGGVEAAKEVCRNTRGPVASIFYQGLDRVDEGAEMVEKSVISYGAVQVGQLERGLVWISLFIALAPMLGFMGTVIGMIQAFDDIQKQGDISPTIVAGGIKVALLTTVAGLIVAIILQLFYNYLVSRIEAITNKMEDSSIRLVDILIRNKVIGKAVEN